MSTYDALVIGAGFAGATVARKLAEEDKKKVLVLESRSHIGGNAYDCLDDKGILIHLYGPHIFHTTNKEVFDFLSRFTPWRDYEHRVVADVHGTFMPVPFNLASLELAFGKEKAASLEAKLLSSYGAEEKVGILKLRESEDKDLSRLADYIYENVFLHYTMKQWGQSPEEIDPNTTARVPVFISRDDRYFQDKYQGMPENGYTHLFENMLDHPNITVALNTPAESRLTLGEDGLLLDGEAFTAPVVYTGAVDELFDCQFGRLPYRTLDFEFENWDREEFQTHGTVNYTVSEDYTRITEFKHLTGQVASSTTTMKEYSLAYEGKEGTVPYYTVISPESLGLYEKYVGLGKKYENLHLLGRLAEYKYYNMDAITEKALALADALMGKKEEK